jgi:plastocyanin
MVKIGVLVLAVALMGACGEGEDSAEQAQEPAGETEASGEHGEHGDGEAAEATCTPSGDSLSTTAQNTSFNTSCLAAPAGRPFTISFENKDSLAHNLAILESHEAEDVLFRGDIFQGPKTTTYNVGALEAGTYAFHCEVHPAAMQGTFVVA